MTEETTTTNSDNDSASDLEDNLILEPSLPLEESDPLENRIEIPEPDADNITVLTHKLPNTPILPWNRYDSPWEEPEIEADSSSEELEKVTHSSDKNESDDVDQTLEEKPRETEQSE